MTAYSESLVKASKSILLLIDVQEKFRPVISGIEQVIHNGKILIQAARRLDVPILITEQYPKALGSSVMEFKQVLVDAQPVHTKLCFSAVGCESLLTALKDSGRKQVVILGVETHVCVLQTGLELIGLGYSVFIVADAVGSRKTLDQKLGLRRLEQNRAQLVSTEMVIFEWLRVAGTLEFKEVQALVK